MALAVDQHTARGDLDELTAPAAMRRGSHTSKEFSAHYNHVEREIHNTIVGLQETTRLALASFFAGGHVLLEGRPGVAKTLLAKSIAASMDLQFSRIQFTPDLLPSDIVGCSILEQKADGSKAFRFNKGPIFANIVLADEINRASPKTQSALLEAMAEGQVTVDGITYKLPDPFFVIATQNPVESEGTFILPEAQLDRFLGKIVVPPPSEDELVEICLRNGKPGGNTTSKIEAILDEETVIRMRESIYDISITPELCRLGVRIAMGLDPEHHAPNQPKMGDDNYKYCLFVRGADSIIRLSQSLASIDGRDCVSADDIREASTPTLQHRIALAFIGSEEAVNLEADINRVVNREISAFEANLKKA